MEPQPITVAIIAAAAAIIVHAIDQLAAHRLKSKNSEWLKFKSG
jgi:hypothetical protein